MIRHPDSHKGENGRIAIIGGSRSMHGAPVFAALSAEASGVDLVHIFLPACHEEVAKQASYNFQVHPFNGNELSMQDIEPILEILASIDCAIIGPGLARDVTHIRIIGELAASTSCPLILDASALQAETLSWVKAKNAILTPHLGELERMELEEKDLASITQEYGIIMLVKGPVDRIYCSDGTMEEVHGGNAGLTVGGTGDALAGIVGGLLAQGYSQKEACIKASKAIKKIADDYKEKGRDVFSTMDVIQHIPYCLNLDSHD